MRLLLEVGARIALKRIVKTHFNAYIQEASCQKLSNAGSVPPNSPPSDLGNAFATQSVETTSTEIWLAGKAPEFPKSFKRPLLKTLSSEPKSKG